MNNGFTREISKVFIPTAVESSTSLQIFTTEMGLTLPETTLEGATLLEVKSRHKRFILLLSLFVALLKERSLPKKSKETQAEV
jgi:hypothetical protein